VNLPVSFSAAAQADIELAHAWYEAQGTGLGADFLRRVKLVEARLGAEPRLYAVVRPPLRRATLSRFPYALFYLIEVERVVVLACLHHRRDPRIWPKF
jgi:plasmid stabilization system protein ParE